MGRPSLALGTFGALRFYRTDNGWRVRTYVRDPDGRTREVERRGRTKNAAEQALKTALRDRSNHGGTTQEITQTTKVRVLAESWFAEFTGNGNALNTIQLYRDRLDRQVIPSLGGLYVHELTPSVIDRHLRAVAATQRTRHSQDHTKRAQRNVRLCSPLRRSTGQPGAGSLAHLGKAQGLASAECP